MAASPSDPCWDRSVLPRGHGGRWLVLSQNTDAGSRGASIVCSCLVLLPKERGHPGVPLQASEGTPFQEENESLHISPSKRGDPSTQLLWGLCVMQSAPSHTQKEEKRVTLSASQPHVRESPSRDIATGGEGSLKEVSLSQTGRFWET